MLYPVNAWACGTFVGLKKMSCLLGLKLQMVMSCHLSARRVLGLKPWCSGRAASALSHRTIPPAHLVGSFNLCLIKGALIKVLLYGSYYLYIFNIFPEVRKCHSPSEGAVHMAFRK